MHLDLYVTLAGLVVGFVVGLTGMGGGALMTPILVLVFGIPPVAAVSSDLAASAVMKPFGGFVHARRGTVNCDSANREDWYLHPVADAPQRLHTGRDVPLGLAVRGEHGTEQQVVASACGLGVGRFLGGMDRPADEEPGRSELLRARRTE